MAVVDTVEIAPFDYVRTLLAQYANSRTIFSLIDDVSQWLDPSIPLNTFFSYVFDIASAQGFGLDIWGRILGVGRVYPIADVDYLGFSEALPNALPFNVGVWWTGDPVTTNYALTDDAYRRLLLAKAFSNLLDGSAKAINQLLLLMFPGRGNVWAKDNNDMTMTYRFEFALTPVDLTLVTNSGVLPAPAGVTVILDHP